MDSSASFTGRAGGGVETTLKSLEAGQIVDGFRLEERLHQGGMASLWRVTRVSATGSPEAEPAAMPLIMKVPRIKGGEDPATIVGFEVEQMILPTLTGPHVPRFGVPEYFATVPELPRTSVGKIDKRELRRRFAAGAYAVQRMTDK